MKQLKGKLLAKFVHGSHLYQLNTPNSDLDFKGVYMPDLKSMYLCEVEDTVDFSSNTSNEKNTSDDTDYSVYSLQKFMELLSKGEMVTFDMLFAPEEAVTYYDHHGNMITSSLAEQIHHPIYLLRHKYKEMFVHRDMKAYLGYCRRQAAKYGLKGSRLSSLYEVKKCIENAILFEADRLGVLSGLLPTNEFLKIEEDHYEVLGKKHQWSSNAKMFKERIDAEIEKFGHRAKQAQQNEGIDWKAVSHAFRAGYQLLTMFQNGEMRVVLPDNIREYILMVKNGKLDWTSKVKPDLEKLIDSVERVAELSTFQDKPDINKIKELTYKMIEEWYDFNSEFSNWGK